MDLLITQYAVVLRINDFSDLNRACSIDFFSLKFQCSFIASTRHFRTYHLKLGIFLNFVENSFNNIGFVSLNSEANFLSFDHLTYLMEMKFFDIKKCICRVILLSHEMKRERHRELKKMSKFDVVCVRSMV